MAVGKLSCKRNDFSKQFEISNRFEFKSGVKRGVIRRDFISWNYIVLRVGFWRYIIKLS